jgi:hypothetical protein
MVADIIHICDLSIMFQFPNVFSSSAFLLLCYRYRLAMDESKSKLSVRCCAEYAIVRYIFRLLYGDRGSNSSQHHSFMRPLYRFPICLLVFFFCFLHSYYRYSLTMDDSKSETNVRCRARCTIVCNFFCNVWEK